MKKITISLICLIILLIGGFTTYKVIKKHNDNLMLVSEKRITEAASRCFNEDKCEGNKVTLKELYNKKYLEQEINPLTKEIYNENSYITKEENTYKFILIS